MSADIDALLARLVVEAVEKVAARTLGNVDQRIAATLHRVLDERQADTLQPLHKIIGGSADAARMQIARDPELAKLAVVVSKYAMDGGKLFAGKKNAPVSAERKKFRPSEVRAYLEAKKRGGSQ